MPYDADNIDLVCVDCGKVTSGPHKDEVVPPPIKRQEYKGAGVSHGQCKDCEMTSENERQMTAKYGPNWREKGQKAKAHLDAEKAAEGHWWWRKMGGK